ncbi:MAG: methyltransferase domain-containing protein [Rhodanobacter sp.]
MTIRDEWQAGVQSEIEFWRAVLVGEQFPDFKQEIVQRLDPETPVSEHIIPFLPSDIPTSEVKILDVAAGPVSCIGWKIHGQRPQITPIDALATQYRVLLDEFHLVPPVYTQPCDGENIDKLFAPDSFDLVHIRNALDHCYDAVTVVRNMLNVLKPGGVLIICGCTDEAVFENYVGLHQWNIRADDGQLIIWRPGERHAVNQLFADQLGAVNATQDDAHRWTSVTLVKKAGLAFSAHRRPTTQ